SSGKGGGAGGVLGGLPVRVVGAALHVVDLLAVELERRAYLDQRLHLALPGHEPVSERPDVAQVARAHGGEGDAGRALHVDDTPPREVALERARGLLLDLSPGRFGDRGKLAVQIIHGTGLP